MVIRKLTFSWLNVIIDENRNSILCKIGIYVYSVNIKNFVLFGMRDIGLFYRKIKVKC